MAITYPLSIPTAIGIAEITLRASSAVAISESPFTYKQQVVAHSGQRWEASVRIPSVKSDKAEEWITFLLKLKGREGTFLMGDPNLKTPRGSAATAAGTPVISGALSSGDSEITLSGLPASTTGYLKPGDYIQLGTGATASLHKVLESVDSDGNNEATFEVWPAVRRSVADAEAVVVSSTVGKFRLSSNVTSWDIDNASFYGISFEAVEAV